MKSWAGRVAVWLGIRLAIAAAVLALLGGIVGVITYFVITPRHFDREAIERMNRVPGVTFIDAKGDILATRGAFHGDNVALKDLPPDLVKAFIATEDRRFYTHWGVDPWGVLRALFTNLRAGYTVQGGSTITQQLAKNLFLSNDRTVTRKYKEVFYAIWLEHHMSKDEILALYLNHIYFGAGTYGVDAASRLYFGKPAKCDDMMKRANKCLTLSEAAMLAGLPKAPTKLAPTSDKSTLPMDCKPPGADKDAQPAVQRSIPKATQERASRVLDNLVEAGFKTEAEVADARAHPAVLTDPNELGSINYYLDYVYGILGDVLGKNAEEAIRDSAAGKAYDGEDAPQELGGEEDMIVYTTLDRELQRKAECSLLGWLDHDGPFTKVDKSSPDPEGALVSIEPDSGAIRAMVGGRSYLTSQFNRATNAMRQPGSAFKPFVYLAALESGQFTPDTIVEDAPIDPPIMTPQGPWSPTDYESDYKGRVTVRQALAESLNTAAVRISETVGPEKVVETAQRMGITSPLEPLHSIALGTQTVTPLELTAAYQPFAKNGVRIPSYTVLKVTTKSGKLLYTYTPAEPKRVIDENTATAMTNLMFGVIYQGTGRAASLGDRPAAGKTGTSSDWRDAWFVGYTANLVTGVWIGNDNDSPMKHISGGSLPARIWKSFMQDAHEGVPIVQLAGAYPSRGFGGEVELKSFYNDLASSFRSAEQGTSPGNAAPVASSTDEPSATVPAGEAPKKKCILFFCR